MQLRQESTRDIFTFSWPLMPIADVHTLLGHARKSAATYGRLRRGTYPSNTAIRARY